MKLQEVESLIKRKNQQRTSAEQKKIFHIILVLFYWAIHREEFILYIYIVKKMLKVLI